MKNLLVFLLLADVILKDNTIRDTKNGTQKAAIFMNKNVPP